MCRAETACKKNHPTLNIYAPHAYYTLCGVPHIKDKQVFLKGKIIQNTCFSSSQDIDKMTKDIPQNPPNSVDFLVVGGGPVGLLAANLAVKAGFTARIIGRNKMFYYSYCVFLMITRVDIEHQPNHWGRGDWIHGRTLELLESVGLAKDLLGTGVKVEKLSSFVNGKLQTSMPFVPDEIDSKHK